MGKKKNHIQMQKVDKAFIKNNELHYEMPITANELAHGLKISVVEIINFFFMKGIIINPNAHITEDQIIDFCLSKNIDCHKKERTFAEDAKLVFTKEDEENFKKRPPIVTIMGHVDHGKTTLLDFIRKTSVVTSESGGITQHIGAYQVKIHDQLITFIDTPGHEAFTSMRSKGAKITDIAIIVCSADDSIMPQTREALDHAKAANLEIIIAINKIDKPGANPEKVKSDFAEMGYTPEEWGGSTTFVEISALKGKNIDKLLETILAIAEIMELKTSYEGTPQGTIIESHLDKRRGPLVTAIVQKGTLSIGDFIVAKNTYGKIKAMFDYKKASIKKALPSTPVVILGLNVNPETGIIFSKVADEFAARSITQRNAEEMKSEDLATQVSKNNINSDKIIKIILKSDVKGSIEAIKMSLEAINTDEYEVQLLRADTGVITVSDVDLSIASNAILVGFNIRPEITTQDYAKSRQFEIKHYKVIYKLIEDIEKLMHGLKPKQLVEKQLGTAEVRQLFKVSKIGTIAGCNVINGEIKRNSHVRLVRDGQDIYETKIESLKSFQKDVASVRKGEDCGILLKNFNDIKEKDLIISFIKEEVK